MSTPGEITDFIPFFENWRGLPHQRAAAVEFWAAAPQYLKSRSASWYQTWQQAGKQEQPRTRSNPLEVPYYSQRDSATAHALRMCFSSSCAMMLETLRPGTLRGPNGDDTYLGRVLRYGDTIHPAAQIKALAHYGVQARFDQACTPDAVKAQIDRGIPVPLGCIHKGGLNSLYGDGHWIIAIGYDDNSLIVNDPYGEMDVVNGGYLNSNGRRLRYSFKNFCRRWEVVPVGSSYRYAPGKGWAVVAEP
jgi:prepilin-type processing-associated H-X9-DG protein